MEFKRYNSIDNSYRQKAVDYFVSQGYCQGEWVVTEKVHGSNFSFLVAGDEIKMGKRSGLVESPVSFFRADVVFDNYKDRILKLRDLVLKEYNYSVDEVSTIQIFGEIYGGDYPHPEVPNVADSKKVQKGVYYCPHNDFFPFDIYIRLGETSFPIDHDLFERLVKEAGFEFFAEALFTGSFQECLEYKNLYPSTLPARHGLPEIEGNICEGNVLKPIKAQCTPIGERIILKNKNDKFTETSKERKAPKQPKEFSPEVKEAIDLACQYVTENRLRNVISHIGEIGQKEFGKLLGHFAKDALSDFGKEYPEIVNTMSREDIGRVNKVVNAQVALLIRTNFINIVDGNF